MDEINELIEIPYDQLDAETLQSVIEAFVLREGTEYGFNDVQLETKTEQVRRQLEAKKVRLVFDPEEETCTLLTEEEMKRRKVQTIGPQLLN